MSAKPSFIVQTLAATAIFATVPAAAQVKAPAIAQSCAAYHGAQGVSTMKDTPSLAGQPDIFTQYQLVTMRDGQRKPGVMQAIVKKLTDQNIRDLGAYYAALPPPPAFRGAHPVNAEKVNAIMAPRRCSNCHKEDFSGAGRDRAAGGPAAGLPSKGVVRLSDRGAAPPRDGRDGGGVGHPERPGH